MTTMIYFICDVSKNVTTGRKLKGNWVHLTTVWVTPLVLICPVVQIDGEEKATVYRIMENIMQMIWKQKWWCLDPPIERSRGRQQAWLELGLRLRFWDRGSCSNRVRTAYTQERELRVTQLRLGEDMKSVHGLITSLWVCSLLEGVHRKERELHRFYSQQNAVKKKAGWWPGEWG